MKYKLGDIAPIKQALPLEQSEYWLLNLDMIESNTGKIIKRIIVKKEDITQSTIFFDSNNVLYSKLRPYLNKVVLPDSIGYGTSELLPLCPNEKIITKEYLANFLRSESFVNYINGKTNGAKMPRVNVSDFLNTEIECPSIIEQRKINNRLEKLSNLLSLRHQQLEKLDLLVKSRFVEMFGDPVTNPMNWEVKTIGDIASDVRYGTSKPAVEGGKYTYLRMNNLTIDGYLDLRDTKQIDIPDNELEKCVVRKGDILFNRTNSAELVGKTAVFDLDQDMVIAGYIIRVRLNEMMLPEVFARFMNLPYMKKKLSDIAKGAVHQANINAQELQALSVYLPDIKLQKQYIEFLQQVDKSKFVIKQSIEKLELLKSKLMQDYFG